MRAFEDPGPEHSMNDAQDDHGNGRDDGACTNQVRRLQNERTFSTQL